MSANTSAPTHNALEAHHRIRLVRSARKLGAVLGSTPQVADHEPPTAGPAPLLPIGCTPSSRPSTPFSLRGSPPSSRPSTPGSIYSSSSTNSSMASLTLSTPRTSAESLRLAEPKGFSTPRGRRSKELPRPLVLRLNAVPMPPTDRRAANAAPTPALPRTPSTPRSSSAPPATPTTPMPPSAAELRRKRMAKLARTLGENVPVDLVFPPSPAPAPEPATAVARTPPSLLSPAAERTRRRRSMSVEVAAAVLAPSRDSRIWVTGGNLWTGEWNRRDIREVQQQLRRLR